MFKWFLDNQVKVNSNRCHLITNEQNCVNLKIGSMNTENSTCEKLLRVKVDNKLSLSEHLDGIIKKARRKFRALSRIFPFNRLIMDSFSEATTRVVLKKGVLKLSQNLQENTYARVSFLIRDSGTGVFL